MAEKLPPLAGKLPYGKKLATSRPRGLVRRSELSIACRMDLNNISTFLAAAGGASIQAIARDAGLSRSTVRRQLEVLEEQMGTPLFQKDKAGRHLTSAGELLKKQGPLLIEHAALLTDNVRAIEEVPRGPLRVALPAGMPARAAARMHQLIVGRWPEVHFEFVVRDDPRGALPDRAHIALTFDGLPAGPGYDSVRLGAVPVRLLATPAYLKRKPIEGIADLADHTVLFWTSGTERPTQLPMRDGTFAPVAPRFYSNDAQMLRAMAAFGAGVLVGPDSEMPESLLLSPDLVRVLPDLIGADRGLDMVVPTVLRDVPKVRALLELVHLVRNHAGGP